MRQPSLHFVACPDATGGHRMAYWAWGDPASAHVVLCVHGLSRQGRDFDELARSLCDGAADRPGGIRVICPDVVGRGHSDWLADPLQYLIPTYAADMVALIFQLHSEAPVGTLDWVGTSMGGLIGMAVCGQLGLPMPLIRGAGATQSTPLTVRRLVLNDVGPALEWGAIERIGSYLGRGGPFDSLEEAAEALRLISLGFGPHTPAQWLALSAPMVKPVEGAEGGEGEEHGRLRLHYDPALAVPFKSATRESTAQGEAMLWQLYDQVRAETLVLRGAESDLLSPSTAQAMTERGPAARLITFSGVGHAPTLVANDQRDTVTSFLLR